MSPSFAFSNPDRPPDSTSLPSRLGPHLRSRHGRPARPWQWLGSAPREKTLPCGSFVGTDLYGTPQKNTHTHTHARTTCVPLGFPLIPTKKEFPEKKRTTHPCRPLPQALFPRFSRRNLSRDKVAPSVHPNPKPSVKGLGYSKFYRKQLVQSVSGPFPVDFPVS